MGYGKKKRKALLYLVDDLFLSFPFLMSSRCPLFGYKMGLQMHFYW